MSAKTEHEMTLEPCPSQVQAQLLLGQTHVDKGFMTEAFTYFEAAARSGHPTALNMLGRAYERGWGVARDARQAASYFEHAAAAGENWAMFNLADLFLLGDGVPQDKAKAYQMYVSSAKRGNAKALNMLGILHEEGITGAVDLEGAEVFFKAAAEGGDYWAVLNLARLALANEKPEEANALLEKALSSGHDDIRQAILELVKPHGKNPAFRWVYHAASL
ncbi:hypothetical protein AA106555_1002 [Neokomagataea thailandica NBRC 106555]|uniref:Sel1 repeat family protein n=2 Tax=Neokomagataea TaxID=1223423 RepID=A0A4Y6V4C0_9PROT|nr:MULTISPECIES: tetratricopeptide repeat protein [Neokomagataea]QDH24783.1 sel1 repeat family protein [Neokomagataea tanensis]GBR52690.1 hypothetical protein AA106555_1002 [Neokomagataea thailandica NBRC 106555]